MKIGNFDTDDKVLIIAEVGNNHEGSYTLAEELVGKAAEAGVDAVKFQTIVTERFVSRKEEARFNRLKSFELTYEQFRKLSKLAKENHLKFISTPFDIESADFLSEIVDCFKIASGDNNFYPLIDQVISYNKPVLISTGLLTHDEVVFLSAYSRKRTLEMKNDHKIGLLHCVTSYPVAPEEANLGAIMDLKKIHGNSIGYSDHTIGLDAVFLSVALGARIIEKHFTIDKNYSSFRDHQLSADPNEMKKLVESVRLASKMIGSSQKSFQSSENENKIAARRSICLNKSLKEGSRIQMQDLICLRPGGGVSPGNEYQILGRRLIKNLEVGDIISLKDLE